MELRKRILVFPCGSEIGLEIHNALQFSRHVDLFGGSSIDDNGKYIYKNYIGNIPFVYDKKLIPTLNKIIHKYKIDFIYPAHDDVVYYLSKNSNKLECEVLGPDVETAEICRFKNKTYEYFKGLLPVPKIYSKKDSIDKFPVFLKPKAGQGARGTFKAENKDEVDFYLKKDKSLLILEFLPGQEYTVDCFTDRNRKLKFVGPRVRARIKSGISVNTYPVKNKNLFVKFANIINNNIKLRGAWFFQLKRNKNGKLVLLEIAPRIAGSMALYRNLGINFELMTIFDRCNIDVDIEANNFNIILDRSLYNKFKVDIKYDCVYVDLDDCLLIRNKINTNLVAFLYQCVNKGKLVYLITKHNKNVEHILEKYKLSKLFDKVFHIDISHEKAEIIKHKKAIFIDDSFSERIKVKRQKQIPVFSPDAIECLLD